MNDVNLNVEENNSLVDVLNDPKKKEVFLEQIDKLVKEKISIKSKTDFYNDDVKSTAEAFNLSKGFLSTIVNDLAKGDVEDKIKSLEDHVDLLQVINEEINLNLV